MKRIIVLALVVVALSGCDDGIKGGAYGCLDPLKDDAFGNSYVLHISPYSAKTLEVDGAKYNLSNERYYYGGYILRYVHGDLNAQVVSITTEENPKWEALKYLATSWDAQIGFLQRVVLAYHEAFDDFESSYYDSGYYGGSEKFISATCKRIE